MPTAQWHTSPKREIVLDIRSYLAPQWQNLLQSSRDLWTTWATEHPLTDRFGNSYNLSGFGWYMRLNIHLLYHEAQQLAAPPDLIYPPFLATATAQPVINSINLYWTLGQGELHYDDYVDIFVHYRQSFGRAADRRSALIYHWTGAGNLSDMYAPAPPGNYTFWLRPTNLLSGLQVQEIRCDCVQPIP